MTDDATKTKAGGSPRLSEELERAGAEALLRHLLAEHFYVDSGGLTWSYIEGTSLGDVDRGKNLERALLPYLKPEDADALLKVLDDRAL